MVTGGGTYTLPLRLPGTEGALEAPHNNEPGAGVCTICQELQHDLSSTLQGVPVHIYHFTLVTFFTCQYTCMPTKRNFRHWIFSKSRVDSIKISKSGLNQDLDWWDSGAQVVAELDRRGGCLCTRGQAHRGRVSDVLQCAACSLRALLSA
jgi:hypothetical protein